MTLEQRFWSHVDKTDNCWNWSGYKGTTGYGWFNIGGTKSRGAHRVSWELKNGPIPERNGRSYSICHKCDNPSCVNPDHLFLGTDLDNATDSKLKNRRNRPIGTKNPKCKLQEKDILFIRKFEGIQRDLAKMFNVTDATISDIINNRTWRNLPC